MKEPPGLKTSVVLVRRAGGRRFWFGVVHLPRTRTWLVWLSVFGNDVEALTGWTTKTQAQVALRSYLDAAGIGRHELLATIERSRGADGHSSPGAFDSSERDVLFRAIAAEPGEAQESDPPPEDTPAPLSNGHLIRCAVCRGTGRIVVGGPSMRRSARECVVCRGRGWAKSQA